MLSERNLRIAAVILALAGIGVATYIAIAESGGGTPKCLAGGHGCETVAKSHYSHLAGINVAGVGVFGYGLLLAAAGVAGRPRGLWGFPNGVVGVGVRGL